MFSYEKIDRLVGVSKLKIFSKTGRRKKNQVQGKNFHCSLLYSTNKLFHKCALLSREEFNYLLIKLVI